MKVLCCYARLDGRTENSIRRQTKNVSFVNVAEDPFGYWKTLKEHWNRGEDLVVIEHDIGLRGGEIESFDSCEMHWCTYQYSYPTNSENFRLNWCLGCTKFSAELQRHMSLHDAPVEWKKLDRHILRYLLASRFIRPLAPCVHGEVDHYHEIESAIDPVKPPPPVEQFIRPGPMSSADLETARRLGFQVTSEGDNFRFVRRLD